MARLPARIAAAALLAALLPGIPGGVRAEEPPADPAWAAARSSAAARLSALGGWCRGRGLKATARRHFAEALRLDPATEAARLGLGHRRGPEGWTEPAAPDRAPDATLSLGAAVAALEKETLAALREAAGPFREIARASLAAGRAAEARAAWERVNSLDPEDADAREALGLAGAARGWLAPGIPSPSAALARYREHGRKGAARMPGPDPGEEYAPKKEGLDPSSDLGEARFGVRSYLKTAPARDLLEGMLGAEAILEGAGIVPPRGPRAPPAAYHLFDSKAAFDRAIDGRKDRDDAWKRGKKTVSGFWWSDTVYLRWSTRRERALDASTHFAVHHVLDGAPQGTRSPPWMEEGLAHLCSHVLGRTVGTWCVSLKESGSRREVPEDLDWDEEARVLVRSGDDPPLAALAVAGYNDLDVDSLVKGRSLASWLGVAAPDAFGRWCAAAAAGRKGEDLVREVFGAPAEAVELRWRLWALRK